jgi:hypothetical protein
VSGPSHRDRLRWLNGIGFALTLFYGLWLIAMVMGLLQAGRLTSPLPLPQAFVVVGALSLVASVVLLAILLFGYVFQGADLGEPTPRYILFGWTCAAGLFFLSQTLALVKVGGATFPHVPEWLSTLYWYFLPVGAACFAVLLYVNAEAHHHFASADDPDDDPADEG